MEHVYVYCADTGGWIPINEELNKILQFIQEVAAGG